MTQQRQGPSTVGETIAGMQNSRRTFHLAIAVCISNRREAISSRDTNKSRDASNIWETKNSREARTEGIPATARMPVKAQTTTTVEI